MDHVKCDVTAQPGATLLQRCLPHLLRPKSHALFLDGRLNSKPVVAANVYRIFALAFVKLHWCVCVRGGQLGRS